jgi:hypothetical protein
MSAGIPGGKSPTPEEREQFFRQLNEQIAATQRNDPASWEAELEERRQLEGTLMDGLEDEGTMIDPTPAAPTSPIPARHPEPTERS